MFKWFTDEELTPWITRYKIIGTISSLIILIGFINYGYHLSDDLYYITDDLFECFLTFNKIAILGIILCILNQTVMMLIINVVMSIHTIKENSNKPVSNDNHNEKKPPVNKTVSIETDWFCTSCGCKNPYSRTTCMDCGNLKK